MINLKITFYEDKKMWDIMIKFYLIKRNLTISRQSSVQKGIWHQSQGSDILTEKFIAVLSYYIMTTWM